MVTQLGFPYLDGTTFTSELFARGGFGAVDEAWADPPGSTEQVLHFEAYIDDEEHPEIPWGVNVSPDYDIIADSVLGEGMTAIWLGALGVDQTDADVAAAGWAGDAIVTIQATGSDDIAVVLFTEWDTAVDATEFISAYEDALGRTNLFGTVNTPSDHSAIVIQGTSQELVDQLDNPE
jgi:hypothetical protein